MRTFWALAVALSLQGAIAVPFNIGPVEFDLPFNLVGNSISDSPTGGYAPGEVDCPSDRPTIRKGGSLSPQESQWLERRRTATIDPMQDLLERTKIDGFDAKKYISSHAKNVSLLPNYGIGFSGGGYRALMNSAGMLAAFDSRTVNSTKPGHLGGLLQGATYVAGISGGSWLVGSIFVNNFSTVAALQYAGPGSVWQFGNSILEGPSKGGIQLLNTADYYKDIADMVGSKSDAGFNTTITDYWGRALSYQLIWGADGAPGVTFSSIALDQQFIDGKIPMPILVSNGRNRGEFLEPTNTTVFEFNPFELGTSDPTVYGFAPTKYLGTKYVAGVVPDDEKCVRGFDNAGFIIGTSSSLFNAFLLNINGTAIPKKLKDALRDILEKLSETEEDIADYTPNPFYKWNGPSNLGAIDNTLSLVDGGEAFQNIPLHPMIQPERAVDVIFAVDSSADATGWPNGTSLVTAYQRSLSKIQNGTAFPAIPDQNTFVNLGLNARPSFFGCDRANLTGPSPIIVYLPNSPYSFLSNISTFQPTTSDEDRDAIIQNGYNAATMANGTVWDSQWPSCVGCVILSRSFDRTNTKVPEACKQCFQRYCWNGTTDYRTPPPYEPPFALWPNGTSKVPTMKRSSAPQILRPLAWNFAATLVISVVMTLI
ncbi:Lysophospholipase 1 [Glutinoglossum americanum]|uniref:Lysophospholipase n=1 Tax=Glutinoglossum americanum TaxID=1670608 RepID=A0A9P8KY83_9PEZI|nr:Lysophospholipase 1 [Glutinoglossum americanum]